MWLKAPKGATPVNYTSATDSQMAARRGLALYCIDGVVIAAQCTATFLRPIVLPEFGHQDVNMLDNFAHRPIFQASDSLMNMNISDLALLED